MKHRVLSLLLLLALTFTLAVPASALLFSSDSGLSVQPFSKNGLSSEVLSFSADDFKLTGSGSAALDSIVLTSLPDAAAGLLRLGNAELAVGERISMNAVNGLRFCPLSTPLVNNTGFTFTPIFSDGVTGEDVTVSVYLLEAENSAPIAENLTLATYKNVAATGQFAAVDPEGDLVTFQLVSKPARGEVTFSDDGSGTFVYTPYENKTGKDSFTYVAVDSVGNVSKEATVKITISKAKTKAGFYADMAGLPAHAAAIRLAEAGVLVGECMDGAYYFHPELEVTRDQFVAMAMAAAGLDALDGVTITGFSDDDAIPTWAKNYLSSALMSGIVRGVADETGAICFNTGASITKAEATVLLDRLLQVSDVTGQSAFAMDSVPTWAYQSTVNMSTVSVLTSTSDMTQPLTRAEAAEMLCGMLDVLESRKTGWF